MSITEPFSGTPTIGTAERSLPNNATLTTPGVPTSPIATAGRYQIMIDVVTNMAAGDQFTFVVYEKIAGGSSLPVVPPIVRTGKQSHQIVTPWLILKDGWDVTATKNTGTDRVVPFSIRADTSDVNVASISAGAITATSIASSAITSAKLATDAIDSNALAASAVTEMQTGLALSATALSTTQWTNGRAANLDNLDATVSSRSPSATALSTAQWTNGRAALLDNLDATVGSRAAASTALSTVQWTNTRAALQDNLDATTSSRAAAATALSTVQWTNGRAANLDNLNASVSAVSSAVAGVQADTDDIQTRLPGSLDGGNIKASVLAIDSGSLSAIANAIFGFVVESVPTGATTFLQRLRIEWSVFAAKARGLAISAPGSEGFRDAADTKDRATFTLATDGTRTPGTFDGS